jgi:hypothetical protein
MDILISAPSTWAEENIPISETEVEVVTDNTPDIFVSVIKEYGLKIHIKNISQAQAVDYTLNGTSIREIISEYIETGLIEIETDEENEVGFNFKIKRDDLSIFNNTVFGIVLSSGITLSKTIKISDDSNIYHNFAGAGIVIGVAATVIGGLILDSIQKTGTTEVYGNIYAKKYSCWGSWCNWTYERYNRNDAIFRVEIVDANFQKHVFAPSRTWNNLTTDITGYNFHTKIKDYCDDVWITVYAYSEYRKRSLVKKMKSNTWNCFPYESNDHMDIYID